MCVSVCACESKSRPKSGPGNVCLCLCMRVQVTSRKCACQCNIRAQKNAHLHSLPPTHSPTLNPRQLSWHHQKASCHLARSLFTAIPFPPFRHTNLCSTVDFGFELGSQSSDCILLSLAHKPHTPAHTSFVTPSQPSRSLVYSCTERVSE